MKNTNEISVNFSERRPSLCGWQARCGIHSAYGRTRDEALERLNDTMKIYIGLEEILKGCVKNSVKK